MNERSQKYEVIVVEDVHAVIPAHILDRLEEGERYLVETMSRLEQRYEKLVGVAKRLNTDLIDCGQRVSVLEEAMDTLDSRVSALEAANKQQSELAAKVGALADWKSNFTGKWAVIVGLTVVIVPALIKALIDHFAKK